MKVQQKILTIIGSGVLAAILGYFATWIKLILIVPTHGNFLIIDASALDYLFIPIIYFVFGITLAILLLFTNKLSTSVLLSIFTSLLVSFKMIFHAVEIYNRSDVEATYFYRAIVEIISAFLIFPLIAFLIWFVNKSFISKYKLQ